MSDPPDRRPKERCCEGDSCDTGVDRRDFVKVLGFGVAGLGVPLRRQARDAPPVSPETRRLLDDPEWPALRVYEGGYLDRVALPLGGIGTGTVSLGGRGDLRDWEIMNRPAKGFIPRAATQSLAPFLALYARPEGGAAVCRLLEGPLSLREYQGSHGATSPNEHLPRFRDCRFAAAYPFGRVALSDPDVPVAVHLKAFNPLVPPDADLSGIPMAVLTCALVNRTGTRVAASVAFNLPNFVGIDGSETTLDWKGDRVTVGAARNTNTVRRFDGGIGVLMASDGVDPRAPAWGTIMLAVLARDRVSWRTAWAPGGWGTPLVDFWDDFSADGRLDERQPEENTDVPMASLAAGVDLAPGENRDLTFLLAWHFPNRYTWRPATDPPGPDDRIGNYYTSRYQDAFDVVAREAPRLETLETATREFVDALCGSSLPLEVKEAALFNLSTLRTQTCFRTLDGKFFGFEGSNTTTGCCWGSCTHVWNYEQAVPFLFGDLAWSMREVEFAHATDPNGLMSFRVHLPLARSQEFGKAAADGQMGCVMKMYRDWQLSGRDADLRRLWPDVRRALEFCWIPGGWDADRDGVMEGAQHNTMDVEYYGPNPQMGLWYLGALRAAEEMARHVGDEDFARACRDLFRRGSAWIDANLFNGEYYEHQVRPPARAEDVAPSLLVGMGAEDVTNPDYQLGSGCLVDQLVGQYMAHVCGLGYLVREEHVKATLASILKHNRRATLHDHFNPMRSFALDGEAGLLMASYPKTRPENPFPYYGEVMTGFEYTAAAGMVYEGMREEGLRTIADIRARYDGARRNPFDEAECGHHYARAMASWAAVLALTGFHYSAVTGVIEFGSAPGRYPWSSGYAWGICTVDADGGAPLVTLEVRRGDIQLSGLRLDDGRRVSFAPRRRLSAGDRVAVRPS